MEPFSGDALPTFDVPDSTDWLGTPLSGLTQVEQALRCHVCKDFYNSPMITSCNHTFCSICIRRCLSVDGKCPLCRALDQESKLRGNWALREAVDAFVQSRNAILVVARAPAPLATPESPKRKAAELEDPMQEAHEAKRLRRTTRSTKARALEATAAIMRDEVDVPESEDTADYEPEPGMLVALPKSGMSHIDLDLAVDGLVACPICWMRMKPWQVDKHIDTSCPGSPQPQIASSSTAAPSRLGNGLNPPRHPFNPPTPTKQPERLPALAYSMLKDTALRKKMVELGLSTSGSRHMLEKRHQEWMTIWNANCDSARPKKRSELLHDLEIWERTMGSRAPVMSRATNMGAQIKDKDFDGSAWATKHDTSFKDLIARARSSRNKVVQKADEVSKLEEPGPAQEDGKEAKSPVSQPVQVRAAVVDLTGPPSSQPEPPDSPSKSKEEAGPIYLGLEAPYLAQAVSSKGPGDAPLRK